MSSEVISDICTNNESTTSDVINVSKICIKRKIEDHEEDEKLVQNEVKKMKTDEQDGNDIISQVLSDSITSNSNELTNDLVTLKSNELPSDSVTSKSNELPSDSVTSKSNELPSDSATLKSNELPSDLVTSKSNELTDCNDKNVDHTNVVASHYNALKEKGLKQRSQSRIVYMRNFNNWIKSMLINEFLDKIKESKSYSDPIRVLDMCCGKGGDLLKWGKANIAHLICADIAKLSVEQCENRYKEQINNKRRCPRPFTAEFLAYDCSKVRLREKYKDPSMQLDLVSCQFAFHYSFESQSQAECMFKNASESLRPGGYFIGTIPNANVLVDRWKKTDGNTFGNDFYSVNFECDKNNIPLVGAKYNFHLEGVVDCPEFLVHLPTFCKLAWKFGLELVMYERFQDFYERNVSKREGKNLLIKMNALEPYPQNEASSSQAGDSEEYSHANAYMQNSSGHGKIGTLSRSEWEVITIYSVFAFRKAKTIWNAEGKPEYIKCGK